MKYTKLLVIILFPVLFGIHATGQPKTPSSDVILQEAMAKAGNTHKNVFVIFHASWCGWCHKMENSMNDEKLKSFFDGSYVVVALTVDESKDKKVLENPGAADLRKKYNGAGQGLPYWVILDPKGNFLADSRLKQTSGSAGEKPLNVGCPTSEEEVNYFAKVIKNTSSLNGEQLALIKARFLKNKE